MRSFIDHETNTLFICEEASGHQVDINDYPQHLKCIPQSDSWLTICDSASPGSIRKLSELGYNVVGTEKSVPVEDGIRYIRSFKKIVVHTRCQKILKEFKSYRYKKDPKTDEVTPVIIKANDHGMDALRYSLNKQILEYCMTKQQFKNYTKRKEAKFGHII